MQLPQHGSNPNDVYQSLGITQPRSIIDFSVNINPLGAPPALKDAWHSLLDFTYDYPDPEVRELRQLLAEIEQIEMTQILAGNGAAELITLIARFLSGKNVLIIQPAFSSYEAACLNAGCRVSYYKLGSPDWRISIEELTVKLNGIDAVFLCQPNNPTGVSASSEDIDQIIQLCDEAGTLLIIDEAFHDFAAVPQTAISRVRDTNNLLVLRSLTKMYNIAGLRLGYLAGNEALIETITAFQPDWSVNALAQKAGTICLNNRAHPENTRTYIAQERKQLFSFLKTYQFEHSPSAVNFYLLRDPQADTNELFIFLLENGFVLRHTYNFPGLNGKWLRTAVKSKEENKLLMEALTVWKERK